MANRYVDYVTDEHLLSCIRSLHRSYVKANSEFKKSDFYKNKIDVFKFLFDSKFYNKSEENLVNIEITRQLDKTVNNFIGKFHENILGGIRGLEVGSNSGYDIKSTDNTLFAEIKNKHNTMNVRSMEGVYQSLQRLADDNVAATCYCVEVLAKESYNEQWKGRIARKEYNHTRVRRISGDKFYELVTNKAGALVDLYRILPAAIEDYLSQTNAAAISRPSDTVFYEIKEDADANSRSFFNQILRDSYSYYNGSENL